MTLENLLFTSVKKKDSDQLGSSCTGMVWLINVFVLLHRWYNPSTPKLKVSSFSNIFCVCTAWFLLKTYCLVFAEDSFSCDMAQIFCTPCITKISSRQQGSKLEVNSFITKHAWSSETSYKFNFNLMIFFLFQKSFQDECDPIINVLRGEPDMLYVVIMSPSLKHWSINIKIVMT